jgi:hypothetical protein
MLGATAGDGEFQDFFGHLSVDCDGSVVKIGLW